MNILMYFTLALVVVPAAVIAVSFVITNYKQLHVKSFLVAIMCMLIGITGLILCNNEINQEAISKVQDAKDWGRTCGYTEGYLAGVEDTKVTSQIYNVGYDSVEIQYYDGTIHHFSYEPIEVHDEEDGFGAVKTYESYRLITSPTASQTRLNNLDCVWTDENGMRRIYDYYLVALGSYYGDIGDIYQVTLSTGRVLLVIKGDAKADEHTIDSHRVHYIDGSVIEFIVDQPILESKLNGHGDCSYISGFEGSITHIELIGHYDF